MAQSAVSKFCLERRHEYCVVNGLSLEPVITDLRCLSALVPGALCGVDLRRSLAWRICYDARETTSPFETEDEAVFSAIRGMLMETTAVAHTVRLWRLSKAECAVSRKTSAVLSPSPCKISGHTAPSVSPEQKGRCRGRVLASPLGACVCYVGIHIRSVTTHPSQWPHRKHSIPQQTITSPSPSLLLRVLSSTTSILLQINTVLQQL
jgi:hypothetical protein